MVAGELTPIQTAARVTGARTLLRNASGSFGLSVVSTAATVVTTIAMARLMSLEAFGTYSWMVATMYLLSVPAVLGFDRLLIRDTAVHLAREEHGLARGLLRRSIQIVFATCLLIVAGVALVVWAAGPAADPIAMAALLIGVAGLPALTLGFVAQAALIGMHNVVLGQLSELILRPGLLLLMVLGAALVVGAQIDAPLAAGLFSASALISATVAFTILVRRLRQRVPAVPAEFATRRWLLAAVSLVLLGGALLVNSQLGVVMLGVLDEHEYAGLYAVAQRGALLIAFPLMALNAALAPTAARLWAAGDVAQLRRLATLGARMVLLVSVPIALVFILAGEPLLELVFGASFGDASTSLAILSLGQIANAATGSVSTLLIMTGHQVRAGAGIVAGMATNLGLGLLLIPEHHAAGAAIAAATGLVVANLIHVVIARTTLRVDATALGIHPGDAR